MGKSRGIFLRQKSRLQESVRKIVKEKKLKNWNGQGGAVCKGLFIILVMMVFAAYN